jgi:hypothetical protein
MPNRLAPVLVATLAAFAAGAQPAGAVSPVPIELHGLKATPPVSFSLPESAGLDAVRVVHPADAKAGGEKLSLLAVAFPKDSGMTDAELLDYVKTTFLATSDSGRPVERTLLRKKVKGQALEKKIPSPSLAQVYVATKKGGDKVVLAFVFTPGFANEAEAAIAAITGSLKE